MLSFLFVTFLSMMFLDFFLVNLAIDLFSLGFPFLLVGFLLFWPKVIVLLLTFLRESRSLCLVLMSSTGAGFFL